DKGFILYPFDYETYIVNSNRLAFDFNTYTPGVKVYDFDALMYCMQQKTATLTIDNKEWIIKQFWGENAHMKNDALYNKIKFL
ncbi:MAG: hypothetical protein WCZ21_05550, partial [Bacteroidales bacterium]